MDRAIVGMYKENAINIRYILLNINVNYFLLAIHDADDILFNDTFYEVNEANNGEKSYDQSNIANKDDQYDDKVSIVDKDVISCKY